MFKMEEKKGEQRKKYDGKSLLRIVLNKLV